MDKEAVEIRYLLGKLPAGETARLEESYFADDSIFDEIETAEDELVDAYARGSLSSEDRKLFGQKLSSSKRLAERVEFAKLLSKSASSQLVGHESAKARWWERLFDLSFTRNPAIMGAVAAICLVVLGVPAAFVWMRLRNESTRLNTERVAIGQQNKQLAQQLADQQSKTKQLTADLQNSKEQEDRLQRQVQDVKEQLARTNAQPTAPASILLFSNISRGTGEPNVLRVPTASSTIQLKLALDTDDYASYRATIRTPDNRDILTKPGLKLRSIKEQIIILQIPARLLSSGDYVVSVSGRAPSGTYEPVADYPVRVSKK